MSFAPGIVQLPAMWLLPCASFASLTLVFTNRFVVPNVPLFNMVSETTVSVGTSLTKFEVYDIFAPLSPCTAVTNAVYSLPF